METMKNLGKVLIGALIVISGFYSCEKSDIKPNPTEVTKEESASIVAPATWRIVSFQWHLRDSNNHFEDYVFRFNTDKSITAIHNGVEGYGKWDRRGNFLKIDFGSRPLYELNCSWTIVSHTKNSLVLKGLSPYNQHSTQFLEFEKISIFDPN